MKICPKCQKTYADDSLNFCLEDGTVLTQTSEFTASPPATVLINQPRQTLSNQPYGSQAQRQDWDTVPKYRAKPAATSKTWLLAAGILGGLVLICGGGFIGLIALMSKVEDEPEWNSNIILMSNADTNSVKTNSAPDDRKNVTKIDLSKWNRDFSEFGNTDFKNDELIMSSKKDNFYYVLVAPSTYKTENATTKISVRNIDNGNNSLGYGLIIHSNPMPLQQDYAFLIDSKTQRYRVVTHKPQKAIRVNNLTACTR